MPTYEYECKSCGLRFERQQAITEAPLVQCPECNGGVQRLVSGGTGFIFKGVGQARIGQHENDCPLESSGRTCCGREERCGKPPCEGES
ncbi:MAG: zinc ribbon domain-containing protein [Syntrophales bacterium]|nr:zinc ribbon domain-containing protein [Syntrophales bacterium]